MSLVIAVYGTGRPKRIAYHFNEHIYPSSWLTFFVLFAMIDKSYILVVFLCHSEC